MHTRSLIVVVGILFVLCAVLLGGCVNEPVRDLGGRQDQDETRGRDTEFEIVVNDGSPIVGAREIIVQLMVLDTNGDLPQEMRVWEGSEPDGWETFSQIAFLMLSEDQGDHRVHARVRSGDQVSSVRSVTVSLDTHGPALVFLSHNEGQVVQPGEIVLEMCVDDAHQIQAVSANVDGGESIAARQVGERWELVLQIPEGEHSVTASALDELGNASSAVLNLAADGQAPSVRILRPASGSVVPTTESGGGPRWWVHHDHSGGAWSAPGGRCGL